MSGTLLKKIDLCCPLPVNFQTAGEDRKFRTMSKVPDFSQNTKTSSEFSYNYMICLDKVENKSHNYCPHVLSLNERML